MMLFVYFCFVFYYIFVKLVNRSTTKIVSARFLKKLDVFLRMFAHACCLVLVGPAYAAPFLIAYSCKSRSLLFFTLCMPYCVACIIRAPVQPSFWDWLLPNFNDYLKFGQFFEFVLDATRVLKKLAFLIQSFSSHFLK